VLKMRTYISYLGIQEQLLVIDSSDKAKGPVNVITCYMDASQEAARKPVANGQEQLLVTVLTRPRAQSMSLLAIWMHPKKLARKPAANGAEDEKF
jgi:hypothetical protein